MNRRRLGLALAVVVLPLLALAQDASKPYAGQEAREVKALSGEEIRAYLNGEGMGLAKAAELNSYPGPRHVLDLRAQLALSPAQAGETQRAFEKMRREATELGARIVGKEQELNALFAGNRIDESKLDKLTGEIALLQGSLRAAHLRAHLEVKRILTAAQVKKYDQLRGYQSPVNNADPPARQHHGHHDN